MVDLRDSTRQGYSIAVNKHLRPRYGRNRLSQLATRDMAKLIRDLRAEGKSESPIAAILGVVDRIYQYAAEEHESAAPSPTANLGKRKRPSPTSDRKQPYFKGSQSTEGIAAAPEPAKTLFRVLEGTRCRVSEALALRWQDVFTDGDDPRVALNGQVDRHGERRPLKRRENGVGRVVPITDVLAEHLRAHADRSDTPGEYVFATRSGRPLGQRNVSRSLRAAMTAAKREDGTPTFPELHLPGEVKRGDLPGCHGFRHAAATKLAEDGAMVQDVAGLLGHASTVVTETVYTHLDFDNREQRAGMREHLTRLTAV